MLILFYHIVTSIKPFIISKAIRRRSGEVVIENDPEMYYKHCSVKIFSLDDLVVER